MCCDCTHNKHPLVIKAQIFSIVAFLFSFGWIWTFGLGLCAMILQQLLWCMAFPRWAFWGLVATSIALAGVNVFAALAMMRTTTDENCLPILSIEYMCNNARTFYGVLHCVSGGFWLLSAILEVVFVTQKWNENDKSSSKNNADDNEIV